MRRDEIMLDIDGGTKLRFVLTDFGLRVTADGNEVDIADLLPYSDIFKRKGIIYEVIHSRIDLSNYTDIAKRCLWQYDEENDTTYVLCVPKSTVERQRILYVIYGARLKSLNFLI
jgi:hypothetical protein